MNNVEVKSAVVAYHGNCIDGFTSAWVACKAMKDQGYIVASQAMDYTDASVGMLFIALDLAEAERLYIVDYSLSIDRLKQLSERYPSLDVYILDHHKTAFERYAPDREVKEDSQVYGRFYGARVQLDNAESGASLCWKCFNGSLPEPKLVTYVKDYDLWKFNYGDQTRYINKYLCMQTKTIARWTEVFHMMEDEDELINILRQGKDLQRLHDCNVKAAAHNPHIIILAGYQGLAVQCDPKYTSDVGHLLAKQCGTYGAMYSLDWKNYTIKWSLRSDKKTDFDVADLAERYGGGGHKNAAGFTVSMFGNIGFTG